MASNRAATGLLLFLVVVGTCTVNAAWYTTVWHQCDNDSDLATFSSHYRCVKHYTSTTDWNTAVGQYNSRFNGPFAAVLMADYSCNDRQVVHSYGSEIFVINMSNWFTKVHVQQCGHLGK
jgi:hypothetical protein